MGQWLDADQENKFESSELRDSGDLSCEEIWAKNFGADRLDWTGLDRYDWTGLDRKDWIGLDMLN